MRKEESKEETEALSCCCLKDLCDRFSISACQFVFKIATLAEKNVKHFSSTCVPGTGTNDRPITIRVVHRLTAERLYCPAVRAL